MIAIKIDNGLKNPNKLEVVKLKTRNYTAKTMLTEKEKAYFEKQVALSGLSKSKFLRALIEDVEIKARLPTAEYKKIYQTIASLTNNVNQIAKNANSNMYLSQSQLDEAIFLTKKCWQHVKDLR